MVFSENCFIATNITSGMSNPGAEGELRTKKKLKNTDRASSSSPSSSSSSGITTIKDVPFLPDDMIMDILSWLPIKDALRFRCVCKIAKSLMSSHDFINSHNKRHAPVIIVFNSLGSPRPSMLEDRSWTSEGRNSKAIKSCNLCPGYSMYLSQNGLIVSKSLRKPGIFIVSNPIYSDVVKITVPVIQHCEIFGVFYQPCIKEYCTLWAFTASVEPEPVRVQYKMLNLGFEPKWKDVTNPWTQNGKLQGIRPVLVDEYLYWVVKPERYDNRIPINVDILEFDTRNEVFQVIQSPSEARICNINLLQANGLLMLVQFHPRLTSPVEIWTLENRSDKIWTCMTIKANGILDDIGFTAVAFWNGELLVRSDYSELYVCNIKLGTARQFGRKYSSKKTVLPHVMSLASLENCKSDICMVEAG